MKYPLVQYIFMNYLILGLVSFEKPLKVSFQKIKLRLININIDRDKSEKSFLRLETTLTSS